MRISKSIYCSYFVGLFWDFNKEIGKTHRISTKIPLGFCRLLVVQFQCIVGTEKYLDDGMLFSYADDEYSQCYSQIDEPFKSQTKDDILQPIIVEHNFRSSDASFDDV